MNRLKKSALVDRIREGRAELDVTFEELDGRVSELALLPAKIREDLTSAGRWTAIIIGITSLAFFSVLVASAVLRARGSRR